MKKSFSALIAPAALAALSLLAASAQAKLPPPSDDAKASAAAAKDKAAWSDKVAAYQLCMSQDKVAARYLKGNKDAKKPSVETPACVNPGPYVPPAPAVAAAPAAAPSAAPAKK